MAVQLEGGGKLRQDSSMNNSTKSSTRTLINNHHHHKSVVLVKLTDAAFKAIEEYLKHQAVFSNNEENAERKPSIKFPAATQDLGSITIPETDCSERRFSFSLSSNDDAQVPKSSLECLSTAKQGSLESIGVVQEKIHIQASDDTYTRFGQKMVEAKKESEKRTTQLLDRRPPISSSNPLNQMRHKLMRQQHPLQKKHHYNLTHSRESAISSSSLKQQNFLSGNHPMLDRSGKSSNSSSPSYSKMSHVNPDLLRRPLKERIIHLLAVRPFKKPELLSRINRDGILEKDRRNITGILKQVSVMKDNTYHLLRHIWNDVSEDWPFYSEQERQSFKRRKPQNLTPPFSDCSTSSSGHSPSSTHPASPPRTSSSPIKRGYYANGMTNQDDSTIVAKKKRVSNYVRPPDMRIYSPGTGNVAGGGSSYSDISGNSPGRNSLKSSPHLSAVFRHSPYRKTSPGKSPNGYVIHKEHKQQSQPDMEQQSLRIQKDFYKAYPPIISNEQRARYKKEFNDHYNNYCKLHAVLNKVSRRFADLEAKLQQEQLGTESYEKLKLNIVKEYQASKQDQNYQRAKAEFQQLHEKLHHIKTLVHNYDINK